MENKTESAKFIHFKVPNTKTCHTNDVRYNFTFSRVRVHFTIVIEG